MEENNIFLHHLPKYAIELCQPLDSFVIKAVKDCWRSKWRAKKIELLTNNDFSDDIEASRGWSGKLNNPGKRFFLKLAADVIQEVNSYTDSQILDMDQKSMIRCGLGFSAEGK